MCISPGIVCTLKGATVSKKMAVPGHNAHPHPGWNPDPFTPFNAPPPNHHYIVCLQLVCGYGARTSLKATAPPPPPPPTPPPPPLGLFRTSAFPTPFYRLDDPVASGGGTLVDNFSEQPFPPSPWDVCGFTRTSFLPSAYPEKRCHAEPPS